MYGKIENFDFRQLNHHFLILCNDERNNLIIRNIFPREAEDNAILLYGYIDNEAGISFEVLCSVHIEEDGSIHFRETAEDTSMKIRYDSVNGILCEIEEYPEFQKYHKKIDMINEGYRCNPGTEMLRDDISIDICRNKQFPDDVLVYFLMEGADPEGIWCKLQDKKGDVFFGRILNEPYADYGVHVNDVVGFQLFDINGETMAIAQFR